MNASVWGLVGSGRRGRRRGGGGPPAVRRALGRRRRRARPAARAGARPRDLAGRGHGDRRPARPAQGRPRARRDPRRLARARPDGAVRLAAGPAARVEGETQHLGRQTASLAGSLRSSTVRGAWGEVQLRRVLEASGMLPRCDFDEQVTAVSAHDRGVRPDVVVRLPGGKVLVIDAKAPMNAFLDAQAEDLARRRAGGAARRPRHRAGPARRGAGRQGVLVGVPRGPRDGRLLRAERRDARGGAGGAALAARAGAGPAGRARRPGRADGPAAHGRLHLAAGRPVGQCPRAARPRPRPAPPPRHPGRAHRQGRPQPAVQRRGLQRDGRARWSRGSWSPPAGCTTSTWSATRSRCSPRSRPRPGR